MSDYTQLQFQMPQGQTLKRVRQTLYRMFDACTIKECVSWGGRDCYEIVISELDLRESLDIMNKLKKKHGLRFLIVYGVY